MENISSLQIIMKQRTVRSMSRFERTISLLGEEGFNKLKVSHVIVFGCGGVGGYAIEALVRSGIEKITLVDNDTVSESNINRQIIALNDTIGKNKTEVFKDRIYKINPECNVIVKTIFIDENTINQFNFKDYDYVVDAIDSVKSKLLLIKTCKDFDVPVISSMGTANKLDPSKLVITDISKTEVCPLAKVMRVELRKMGINHLTCVYSNEKTVLEGDSRKVSIAFVPSVAGLLIASKVIKDLTNN